MRDSASPAPPLSARTYFSLMGGAGAPADICSFAAAAGYGAVALMDAGNLYGLPEFVDAAAGRGLKALAGCSFEAGGRVLLRAWCLSRAGFSALCALVTKSLAERGFDPVAELCLTGWEGLALASADESALRRLAASRAGDTGFWSRPFVALESGSATRDSARLARSLGLPALAVAGGVLFGPGDAERLRLLAAIDRRVTLSGLRSIEGWREPGPADEAPTAARAAALFSAWPEAGEAAARLALEAADASSFFSSPPVFPAWRGLGDDEAYRNLRRLCEDGASRRYGPGGASRPDVAARLSRELAMIRDKGFSGYFLVVRDIVSTCPRTCGRGSAASSIVSYLLGLTHVDPLAHDLFFERFLNEGRADPPDIDIDFPWDERQAVLEGVFREYAGRAAMVADHCRFSGRSRVREPALAMGKTPDEASRLTDEWRLRGPEALPPDLARASELLRGVPRYIGTHPGGVVVVPGSITDYTHVQASPLGLPVLAWEKDGTERAGLVKIDLLGNRSLAVLRDCIELVSAGLPGGLPSGGALSWDTFDPVDEPSARSLIESGNTIGIFYIESPATRQLLSKMRTADYAHLVAASSIIRPAANTYINEYVRRLRGFPWKRLPEAVEDCLAETYGIMVYQEDVSRAAMAAAGFSAAEADGLRKALTKKRTGPNFPAFRERFMDGCAGRGVSAQDAEELWAMMLSFDGYSFCKAHSASYALVSYRLAWMKARYPGHFICSVINNGGGFYGTQAYVDEAARLGYRVLPPDVNESGVRYRVEREREGADGRGDIRAGLMQVVGASAGFMAGVAAERERGGPYAGFFDFLDRTRPAYDDARAMILAGCLDGIARGDGGDAFTRPRMIWAYHHWLRTGGRSAGGSGRDLFPSWKAPACIGDYSPSRKLADEARFLGILLSRPPASLYAARADAAAERYGWPKPVPSSAMADCLGKRISLVGVSVAGKEVMASTGQAMCFRSFSDAAGVYETVIFPKAYERLMPILEGNAAFLVLGTPRDDLGALALHLEDAQGLNRPYRSGGYA